MLFNSFVFLVFFCLVFIIYWFVLANRLKFQNLFLLIASCVFYGWWDYRFLLLMGASSLFGFASGYWIERRTDQLQRKLILSATIVANLLFLGFFKYYNFFASSFSGLLSTAGFRVDDFTLKIILPIGISFYTFHNISYAIDVYRKELKPTGDIIAYFAFISFFPQLVAGPIMKAKDFLPQFFVKRTFSYPIAVQGLRFILWGYFKKIVIADGCGVLADAIFNTYSTQPSSILLLGVFYFAIQIYGDFSGYTDIAIGLGKLFGFEFTLNFRTPYFSRTIPEFWRRWHISLTSWFRDYIYIPLGGNRVSKPKAFRNIFIVFFLSGLWHGANWTYVVWGVLYALMYIPSTLFPDKNKLTPYIGYGKAWPSLLEVVQMIMTFALVCLAWVFFRSASLMDAFNYLQAIATHSFKSSNFYFFSPLRMMPLILLLLSIEWINRDKECQLDVSWNKVMRWSFYIFLIFLIFFSINFHKATEFIYFQF
jgi:D-alanyl-lipoteichoic acid acyltransferase DltB (MBOAT superfamily)